MSTSDEIPYDTDEDLPADGEELVAYKNWDVECCNCGALPTVGDLELCGPCCWGEASTAGGNW